MNLTHSKVAKAVGPVVRGDDVLKAWRTITRAILSFACRQITADGGRNLGRDGGKSLVLPHTTADSVVICCFDEPMHPGT
ncbi:MAG TPA: hypothetical protein VG498_18900, partial [Terriglobales bacterium]|nr:hypothetical protein [Terriglobales bacterium]